MPVALCNSYVAKYQDQLRQSNRNIHTSIIRPDIDTAARFIGAGIATVGVSGSGSFLFF